ncbi:MAG: ester cyclase [Acidobacteria bacterium]|nr:ester cyclase [Acidobacteriota bacterium]
MDDPGTLYCRFIDSLNRRALDDLDQFLAARVVQHALEPSAGIEAARRALAGWLEAVPDAHLVIEDLVVEGDHLMARLTATGTPRAARGGEPSGTQVSMPVFEAWSVRDGRCVERWLHVDRSQCPPPPVVPQPNRHPSLGPGNRG